MAYIAGGIYFLGIYLHYVYVLTIFELIGKSDFNAKRIIMQSLAWPLTVVLMMSEELFGDDYDDEDDM